MILSPVPQVAIRVIGVSSNAFPEHLYAAPGHNRLCWLWSPPAWRVWPSRSYRRNVVIEADGYWEAREIGAELFGVSERQIKAQRVERPAGLESRGVA